MPANLVGRLSLATLGLAILATAAPAAHAQAHPKIQVEVSRDYTGGQTGYSGIASGAFETHTDGLVRHSVGASLLAPIAPRTSLRIGLLLSSKGFTERALIDGVTTRRKVDFVYLGAPIALGYNLVNTRRGLQPFAEVGILPEVLTRDDDESEYYDPDMRGVGLSYLFSVGLKYNLGDGRALVLAPEVRHGARGYSYRAPGRYDFTPSTGAIKLGFQF
jgi:hypothetical protein